MLQILIILGCGLLVGVGYVGRQVALLNRKDKSKGDEGNLFFVLMAALALIMFVWSFIQAGKVSDITNYLP